MDDCLSTLRPLDYFFVAATTAATWYYGYVLEKPLRSATAFTAAALGLNFAGMYVLQDTRGRLMGYKENGREMGSLGVWVEQVKKGAGAGDRRFPVARYGVGSVIKPVPRFDNYD